MYHSLRMSNPDDHPIEIEYINDGLSPFDVLASGYLNFSINFQFCQFRSS